LEPNHVLDGLDFGADDGLCSDNALRCHLPRSEPPLLQTVPTEIRINVDRELIVVGGPNGAGKTTFALSYREQTGIRYLAADDIATKLRPEAPEEARIEAGKAFSRQLDAALESGTSLLIESTLSGKSFFRCLLGLERSATERGFSSSRWNQRRLAFSESERECCGEGTMSPMRTSAGVTSEARIISGGSIARRSTPGISI
jgi:hypothetical protein